MKIPYLSPPRDSTLREFRTRFPKVWKEKSQGLVDSRGFTGDLFGLPGIPRDSQGYLGIAGFFCGVEIMTFPQDFGGLC